MKNISWKTRFKIIGVLLVLAVGAYVSVPYWYRSVDIVIITEKTKGADNVMMVEAVLASDENIPKAYRNQDCWRIFKFGSRDVQAKLMENKKYEIVSYGMRNRLLSWFPNIVRVERVKEQTQN